jgi:uncharacterized protein YjiS (DUF1127 family)
MHMTTLLSSLAAHWKTARAHHAATRELAAMSACELGDIGITRLDVSRLFEPRLIADVHARGGGGRVATAATFRPIPQSPAARTSPAVLASIESLA